MSDCIKCRYQNKEQYQEPCNRCKSNVTMTIDRFEPKTNADRIRNMTDEELADFINMISQDSMDTICYGSKEYTEIWERKPTTMKWLQSEAKESEANDE